MGGAPADIFGAPAQAAPTQQFVTMFEDMSIKIECTMNRNPMNPQEHQIKAYFSNKTQFAVE